MRVAGIGFRSTATAASIRDALNRAGGDVVLLATVKEKVAALRVLCPDLPIRGLPSAALAAQPVATRSPRVFGLYGTGSIAEAAALAAAGPGGRLLVRRVTSADGRATAAIAGGPVG